MENPLASPERYEVFVYSIQHRYPQVKISTLVLKRNGKLFGELAGQLFFENEVRLFVKERLDFKNAVIKGYGYEVWPGTQKLYWYDSQEHPNDPTLASTHPITSTSILISNIIVFLLLACISTSPIYRF